MNQSAKFLKYLIDDETKEMIINKLVNKLYNNIFNNSVFKNSYEKLEEWIKNYNKIFYRYKYKNLNGGLGFNYGLYLCIKFINSKRVIESGVYKGFLNYIFDSALQDKGQIICLEPNLNKIKNKSEKEKYYSENISKIKLRRK